MLKNYIKIALRNLLKQKGLSLINILGLSIGLACFSLFLLYSVHEFSFDKFHENGDRVYRMYRWTGDLDGEGEEGDPHLPMPLAKALKADFPDVEEVVRWKEAWGESFVRVNGVINSLELCHVDPTVFDVFTFPLKYGDPENALADPSNVVITERIALQLFKESNPVGKQIEIRFEDTFEPFTVAAVAENVPTNSSKQFQIMGSFDYFKGTSFGRRRTDNWGSSFLSVFVKLRAGSGLAENEAALLGFREKYYLGQEEEIRNAGNWMEEGPPVTYRLQPIAEMHTNTGVYGGDISTVEPRSIWILLGIAAGVLLIAIINFTTLSIGRSAHRALEVGVRKVVGSSREQLALQFLTESMLLSIISVAIGLGLAQFLLPYFNELSGRTLTFSFDQFPQFPWLIIALTIITGLLAGIYPAFMISGFRPINVLKNKVKVGGSNWFTKSLVTTQFALSLGLIITTIVVLSQLKFMYNQNPGFQKEQVVVVDAEAVADSLLFERFKNSLVNDPLIHGVAASDARLGAGAGWSRASIDYKGALKQMYEYYIDDDYLDVMGHELVIGRGFEQDRQDGLNRSVIINEAMVKDFGWSEREAIGQELTGYFGENSDELEPRVIGVVKDFNFRSFREPVKPQMFHQFADYLPTKYFVRIEGGNPQEAITAVEKTWKSLVPDFSLQYSFLDEDVDRFYQAEKRFSKVVAWAGGVSIFLACLGLLGLAALAVVNRNKEIGIRKILGANMGNIVQLLSLDFLKLVLVALLIASPIAWYLLDKWLNNFAYRINVEWWVFLLTGVIALVVAFIPLGLQSLKVSLMNPLDSLRNE
jgi:putative ABC transport system permease protein